MRCKRKRFFFSNENWSEQNAIEIEQGMDWVGTG